MHLLCTQGFLPDLLRPALLPAANSAAQQSQAQSQAEQHSVPYGLSDDDDDDDAGSDGEAGEGEWQSESLREPQDSMQGSGGGAQVACGLKQAALILLLFPLPSNGGKIAADGLKANCHSSHAACSCSADLAGHNHSLSIIVFTIVVQVLQREFSLPKYIYTRRLS